MIDGEFDVVLAAAPVGEGSFMRTRAVAVSAFAFPGMGMAVVLSGLGLRDLLDGWCCRGGTTRHERCEGAGRRILKMNSRHCLPFVKNRSLVRPLGQNAGVIATARAAAQ
jgi:hypothetical protein